MKTTGTYSTFTGNSLAGKGKLFYGLTPTMLDRIKLIRVDTESGPKGHTQNLYSFAAIYIKHARELAKCGQKDEARNWYRFFNNSQIVSILEDLACAGDLKNLREDLDFLGLECHPLDVPSFTTDLESIKHCLKEIFSHVEPTPRKTKTVRRSSAGRTFHGNLSHE